MDGGGLIRVREEDELNLLSPQFKHSDLRLKI